MAQPSFDSLDSCLIAALQDSRERIGVLNAEQALIAFCSRHSEAFLEMGGSYNSICLYASATSTLLPEQQQQQPSSFQRCWLHRLCDRFGYTHREHGTVLAVRIYQTENAKVPATLIRNMVDAVHTEAEEAIPVVKTRVKIMKRTQQQQNANNNDSKTQQQLQQQQQLLSVSDKERAYEEARARIFGSPTTLDPTDESTTLESIPYESTTPSPTQPAMTIPAAAAASSTSADKAVYRNRMAEAADPDFQRGVLVVPAPELVWMLPPTPSLASTQHHGMPLVSTQVTTAQSSVTLTADAPAWHPNESWESRTRSV
jgi:hypothetical protein